MGRYRGKKALYEVMSKARVKPVSGKTVEPLRPAKGREEKIPVKQGPIRDKKPITAMKWLKKPKFLTINAGKIEISVSYQIVVVVFFLLLLIIIAAYQLGQRSGAASAESDSVSYNNGDIYNSDNNPMNSSGQTADIGALPGAGFADSETEDNTVTDSGSIIVDGGDHVIVLAHHPSAIELEPVVDFFKENDIELEIVKVDNQYRLQTLNTYESTNVYGTNGYLMLEKIKNIGLNYKNYAPEGYEQFAPHYFQDAYGDKIN